MTGGYVHGAKPTSIDAAIYGFIAKQESGSAKSYPLMPAFNACPRFGKNSHDRS
jgi:hypothetical protein